MKRRRSKRAEIIATGIRSNGLLERLSGRPEPKYELRLYIAGSNLNSARAIEHLRDLCQRLEPSECKLEIIDLYQQPGLAKRDEVVAAPALVKVSPLPSRTFVGDLSDTQKVLSGLGITISSSKDVRNK
jgi:circadian clock protein KaiB